MDNPLSLLIVEDSEDDAFLLLKELRRGGYQPQPKTMKSLMELDAELNRQPWDMVISDYNLPGFTGLEVLARVRETNKDVPFILVSGRIGEDKAVEVMKAGAQDYIMKGNLTRLVPAVSRELHESRRRKKIETELRESEEQLRQVQKLEAVGQLAAGLAHDFNNILGVVALQSEAILRNSGDKAVVESCALSITQAHERASNLVGQLLTFGRKRAFLLELLNLNLLVENLKSMLTVALGSRIMLTLVLDSKLPDVMADPVQLEQVIMNLAVNARDSMPEGGTLRIETGCETATSVLLSVSDSGCGMDPEIQARIFEPFFTTKEIGKGTGLGLAIAFGIVKQHGGDITAQSSPGKGATFRIRLPSAVGKSSSTR